MTLLVFSTNSYLRSYGYYSPLKLVHYQLLLEKWKILFRIESLTKLTFDTVVERHITHQYKLMTFSHDSTDGKQSEEMVKTSISRPIIRKAIGLVHLNAFLVDKKQCIHYWMLRLLMAITYREKDARRKTASWFWFLYSVASLFDYFTSISIFARLKKKSLWKSQNH